MIPSSNVLSFILLINRNRGNVFVYHTFSCFGVFDYQGYKDYKDHFIINGFITNPGNLHNLFILLLYVSYESQCSLKYWV